jgi:undecaprenyl-diphosphatase
MSVLEAIILGILQGLTEFLPVSSSGHVILGSAILGVENEEDLLFTVIVHFATALSTILVFRKDIASIIKGLFGKDNEQRIFASKIILSMVPAALVGILLEEQIDQFFGDYIWLIGICLILTGLLLVLADRAKQTVKNVGYLDAFIIGISQAIAILPGISRAGATISTAVLLKIDREKAARFSFLMVIPLILGKMAKDLMGGDLVTNSDMTIPLIAAFIAAFVVGVFACHTMIALVKRSQLTYFSIYCFIIGTIAISTLWWL